MQDGQPRGFRTQETEVMPEHKLKASQKVSGKEKIGSAYLV